MNGMHTTTYANGHVMDWECRGERFFVALYQGEIDALYAKHGPTIDPADCSAEDFAKICRLFAELP